MWIINKEKKKKEKEQNKKKLNSSAQPGGCWAIMTDNTKN